MQSDVCNASPDLLVERQLCFLLHRNTARFIGRWDRLLRGHNLTFSEYIVLLAMLERSPVSETALAMRLQFDPYTLEDALSGLERNRLVSRGDDHGLVGHRVVEVTRKGVDMQPEIEDIRNRFVCQLGLAPKDAEALIRQLENLSHALAALDLEHADHAMRPL